MAIIPRRIISFLVALAAAAILLVIAPAMAWAVPSDAIPKQVEQSDGTEITITRYGDEFFSWNEDAEGYIIAFDPSSKNWRYAYVEKGRILPGEQNVGEASQAQGQRLTRSDIEDLIKANHRSAYEEHDASCPSQGDEILPADASKIMQNQKILLLLIGFNNVDTYVEEQHWSDKYFSPNSKSVVNYFETMSGGRNIFGPAATLSVVKSGNKVTAKNPNSPVPWASAGVAVTIHKGTHEGVVRATIHMDHPIPDWEAQRYATPTSSQHQRAMVEIALNALYVGYSYDFASYGSNLHIAAVIAGGDAAAGFSLREEGQVWGHKWAIDSRVIGETQNTWTTYMLHGEMLSRYETTGIGIACHELGHTLGLPDLYDITNATAGVGPYSLMGNGSWGKAEGHYIVSETPTALDAWSMIALGYVTPITVNVNDLRTVNLHQLQTGNYNVLKVCNTVVNPNQYFLLENRGVSGYDTGLYGHYIRSVHNNHGGILIYHVDESVKDAWGDLSNRNWHHRAVDVEAADGSTVLVGPNTTDFEKCNHFFSTNQYKGKTNNEFSPLTAPHSNFHRSGHVTHTNTKDCHPQTVPSGIHIKVNSPRGATMAVEAVVKQNVTKVDTHLKTVNIVKKKSLAIPFVIYDSSAEVKAPIKWKSSNTKVATVSQKGVVKGVKKGKATITATAENGKSLKITVNVSDKAVKLSRATVSAPKSMRVGSSKKLAVKPIQKNATGLKVTFTSSKPSGLYVDKAGKLTAKKKGTYKITTKVGSVTVKQTVKVI